MGVKTTFGATLFSLLMTFLVLTESGFRINRSCMVAGICVDIWKCPFYVKLLYQTPRPPHLVKRMQENLCGFVNEQTPKVCCPTEPPSQKTENEDLAGSLPVEICGPVSNKFRVYDGVNAKLGEFPWMALLAYKTDDSTGEDNFTVLRFFVKDELTGESSGDEFRCGGTVINKHFVLTAAHCIDKSSILGVRLGEYNIFSKRDCDESKRCQPPVQDSLISKVIVHELYDPVTFLNDIALVKLATPANFTSENIKPICLPVKRNREYINLIGKFLTVTGWGITESGDRSSVLRKTSLPVKPIQECQELYKKYKPITKNQICAGGFKGRDSCAGDSGGPLKYVEMVDRTPRYVQYGIVSYGPTHCGFDGLPGIYTNVAGYMDWILNNIE